MYNLAMETMSNTIRWLLEGDPSIRWQVLRDLRGEPVHIYERERILVAAEGWGARLLAKQDADGNWGRGIYSPKWKSTTYTLLHLRQLGLSPEHPQALRGCEKFFSRGLERDGGINLWRSHHHSETCINGMFLALLAYFGYPDKRIHSVFEFLLNEQMPDGGWNCERIKGATHASFHTTISVLEGLDEYGTRYPESLPTVMEARAKAHEFFLQHRLYKSHRTDEIFDAKMTLMHFPTRWRYDFLRGLDYFQRIDAPKDERMNDAIQLLRAKQNPDETWPLNAPWPGLVYFHMEATSQPSRWNTLRALRVLKWWQ
jgi:hypothetical protein